ncbi:MAG: DUF2651 family protein [Clostridia bacterium]|nr:DUF2651 family protein [Clostridia bacterium]
MNNLLVFFALPLATIIIAIVLERIWKNYILVTLFTFAVYLIVAFALGDATLLVLVIIYTFLAFVAAFLSMAFRKINKKLKCLEETENCTNNCNNSNNTQNLAINARVTPNSSTNGRTGSFRGQYRRRF